MEVSEEAGGHTKSWNKKGGRRGTEDAAIDWIRTGPRGRV